MTDARTDGAVPGSVTGQPLTVEAQLEELRAQVQRLQSTFDRRLLEDRDRRRMYDELYRQLEAARAGVTREIVAPLARQILLAVDRLEQHPEPDDFLESLRIELLEILVPHGLIEITVDGEFDPARHESLGFSEREGPSDGIAEVLRTGYMLGDHLLRPAKVTVFAQQLDEHTSGDSSA